MADYRYTVGTGDPSSLAAETDEAAIRLAIAEIQNVHHADLDERPQTVVSLVGPGGLVSRPSERIDEFVRRLGGPGASSSDTIEPGDANALIAIWISLR